MCYGEKKTELFELCKVVRPMRMCEQCVMIARSCKFAITYCVPSRERSTNVCAKRTNRWTVAKKKERRWQRREILHHTEIAKIWRHFFWFDKRNTQKAIPKDLDISSMLTKRTIGFICSVAAQNVRDFALSTDTRTSITHTHNTKKEKKRKKEHATNALNENAARIAADYTLTYLTCRFGWMFATVWWRWLFFYLAFTRIQF